MEVARKRLVHYDELPNLQERPTLSIQPTPNLAANKNSASAGMLKFVLGCQRLAPN